jgi:hypothetical protein
MPAKIYAEALFQRFFTSPCKLRFGEVDASHAIASFRQFDSVPAGAAADIDYLQGFVPGNLLFNEIAFPDGSLNEAFLIVFSGVILE